MTTIVPYSHVLMVGTLLFGIGVLCVMIRRQLLMILIGVEIMLNGAALIFVAAALHFQKLDGQIVALFIIAVAAAEVSIGLALIVAARRQTGEATTEGYTQLRG
ncbi:MAG: NADH-quinone oxidoreductase subunit NuoK [Deltaproteobacteria bacterium]|jgi:NADH-quinone oxidoreductase subunit K